MTTRPIDYAQDGYHVLALAEQLVRSGQDSFSPASVYAAFPDRLPHLTAADFERIFDFLERGRFIEGLRMYGGTVYSLTDKGNDAVWRGITKGEPTLQFGSSSAPIINIAHGATAPVQANVNTGVGTIHATQTNTFGAAEQAQIVTLLQQLQEAIGRLPASPDQEAAQRHADTAAAAAGQGRWQDIGPRMHAILATVGLIVSTTADSQPAIETAQRILHVLGVGT